MNTSFVVYGTRQSDFATWIICIDHDPCYCWHSLLIEGHNFFLNERRLPRKPVFETVYHKNDWTDNCFTVETSSDR